MDYVTSFALPFRLLLLQTPQLIDRQRDPLQLSQKRVVVNGKKRGTAYSIKADLSTVPDAFRYRFSSRIRRIPSAVTDREWERDYFCIKSNPEQRNSLYSKV